LFFTQISKKNLKVYIFGKCRWVFINIDFIAFDTWISLPLNPWYQKISKI